MLGCRLVPAPARKRIVSARGICAALAASTALLAAPGVQADDPTGHGDPDGLRSANRQLAVESRSVVLELYALESRLARAQRELAAIRSQAAAVARRQDAARDRLGLLQRMLRAAESRLSERLRELYVEDDPDPLAVLLGATSLDEALATLENLGHFARQDAEIVEEVKKARGAVRRATRELEEQAAELRATGAAAERTHADLVEARSERRSYLDGLRRTQRLNEAELARLMEKAAAAEANASSEGTQAGASPAAADEGPATSSSSPAEGEQSASPPTDPGTQMTVVATGYSISGNTATGMPVGWGVVAVDPSVIPLGTRLTIPGYGKGVAADTGGNVRGAMIDLWFPTRADALAWGRRTVTITLH